MAGLNPYYIASGVLLLLLPILYIASFLLRGFFWKFLKVRSSQGKLILLRVRTLTTDYFATGTIADNSVRWKDRKGGMRTTPLTNDGLIQRVWGVNCIDTDEATNCFFKRDGTGISSNDSELNDDLILRALNKPSQEKKILIAILIIGIITLLAVIGVAFFTYKNYQLIQQLGTIATQTIKAGVA